MKRSEFEKMYLLEDCHFWFVGKRMFIETFLNKITNPLKNILDIGCGTGSTTKFLEKFGTVVGIEKNIHAISLAKKRGVKIIKGEINNLPYKNSIFDLVTVFDVLYHKEVKNVDNGIKEIYRVLKPGGNLLITDSAFNFLKGRHGRSLHEVRRFTIKKLKRILTKNSFQIRDSSYIFFSLLPLIFIKRNFIDKLIQTNASDVVSIPRIINLIFIFLLKLESLLLKYINFPVGSSLIILVQKNE